ncbi:MAG: hypothetical protein QM214_00010 [Bacillota bacterium]|jgi:hypothetical protein|nr:hypothetical protein [Bacillota bacterium]
MRIQFYPTEDLEKKLTQESARLGINISVLVVDVLKDYYGLKLPNTKTEAELEIEVMKEIEEFVNHPTNVNIEFDLNMASKTYNQISMTYSGKPKIVKARIGRAFAKKVGVDPSFKNVEQVFLHNGKPKRSVGNRAALYIVKNGDVNEQEYSSK